MRQLLLIIGLSLFLVYGCTDTTGKAYSQSLANIDIDAELVSTGTPFTTFKVMLNNNDIKPVKYSGIISTYKLEDDGYKLSSEEEITDYENNNILDGNSQQTIQTEAYTGEKGSYRIVFEVSSNNRIIDSYETYITV